MSVRAFWGDFEALHYRSAIDLGSPMMSRVDPIFAQWLQANMLWHLSSDAGIDGRWGKSAKTVDRQTTIAELEDARQEALRRLEFFGVPIAVDQHLLKGSWMVTLGRVITLESDRLGYSDGADVFVIGVQDDLAKGTSQVTVLRRLA